jgi:hypothetical protein
MHKREQNGFTSKAYVNTLQDQYRESEQKCELLSATLHQKEDELTTMSKNVKDLELQLETSRMDGKKALSQIYLDKLKSSKRYDHLMASVEDYSVASSSDFVFELCTTLATGINKETTFLFQFMRSQLQAMLLKDIRTIRWADDYPIVLLWSISVYSKLGKSGYETLMRGFSHRREDPTKNWCFVADAINFQLPCSDTLDVYQPKMTGQSCNMAMMEKWLEILVSNKISIDDLGIQFDATDLLGGLIVDAVLGIVHGTDWEAVKISEFKAWYELNKHDLESKMATKVYQSILSTCDGKYSILFTSRFIHGEDNITVGNAIDEAKDLLQKLGEKLGQPCKFKYLCSDLNDGAERYKDKNASDVEGTSCVPHAMKLGINELYDHANLVPLHTFNVEPFERIVKLGERVGQEVNLESAHVNLITVKANQKATGLLQLSWSDKVFGSSVDYIADVLLRPNLNEVKVALRPPINPETKSVTYFSSDNNMITIVINSNGFTTMKTKFSWTFSSDVQQDFKLELFPEQMDIASLDCIKNNWESIFHKYIPWSHCATRDKQSETGSNCFFQEGVMNELKKIEATQGTQLLLNDLADMYSIMDRNQSLELSKMRFHRAKVSLFNRKSKLERSGLQDFFSKAFYHAFERNDNALQKIQPSDHVDLRTVFSDALIEGSFGIVRMLKGTFDCQQFARLIGILQLETLKSSSKQVNIGYSFPRGINNIHYISNNQTLKDSRQDEDNGMRPKDYLALGKVGNDKRVTYEYSPEDLDFAKNVELKFNPVQTKSLRQTMHARDWKEKLERGAPISKLHETISFGNERVVVAKEVINPTLNFPVPSENVQFQEVGTKKKLESHCTEIGCNRMRKGICIHQRCKACCKDLACPHYNTKRGRNEILETTEKKKIVK